MSSRSNSSEPMYDAVVNQEGQYSIWPADKALPQGWTKAGTSGSRADCLAFISEAWTDMRPVSIRAQTESMSAH